MMILIKLQKLVKNNYFFILFSSSFFVNLKSLFIKSFVKLDKINSGLIHISEIDDKYIDDLHKYAQVDELIRVRVLGKTEEGMFRLSIKKLDYRITNRHDSKIKETPNGFRNLALHLDYWILKELNTTKK